MVIFVLNLKSYNMKKIFLLTVFTLSINLIFAQYSGGLGTKVNPYQIANLSDLEDLSTTSTDWDKHFILTSSIDASSTSGWNAGEGFSPIGTSVTKFTGSLNGANKGNDDAPNNKIYIRLADVLLWKAEAYIEKGNFPEAIAIIFFIPGTAFPLISLGSGTTTVLFIWIFASAETNSWITFLISSSALFLMCMAGV